MKRVLVLFVIMGLIGCAKKQKLSEEEASSIAQAVVLSTQNMATGATNPSNLVPSTYKGKDGVTITGDTTDADGDGVTVSGKYTFDICETTMVGEVILKGVITHDDSLTDNDPFAWHIIIGNGDYFIYKFWGMETKMKGDITASHSNSTYSISLNLDYIMTFDTLTFALSYDMTYSFTADDTGWQPGEDLTGGTLTISGQMSYSNEESHTLTISTPTPLHFTCSYTGQAQFDSGVLEIKVETGDVITIEFQSNGTYIIKLNGKVIS